MSWVVRLPSNSYKPISNTAWVRSRLCKLQKKMQMIKFTSYLSMVGGSLASSTTKTGRHDIAEILLKVALNTKNQSIYYIRECTS